VALGGEPGSLSGDRSLKVGEVAEVVAAHPAQPLPVQARRDALGELDEAATLVAATGLDEAASLQQLEPVAQGDEGDTECGGQLTLGGELLPVVQEA